jgi:outer membrane biogenesis lipoprotein LolB
MKTRFFAFALLGLVTFFFVGCANTGGDNSSADTTTRQAQSRYAR